MLRPVINVYLSKDSKSESTLDYDYYNNTASITVNSKEELNNFLSNIGSFFDRDREYKKMKKEIYSKERGLDDFLYDLDEDTDLYDYIENDTDILNEIEEINYIDDIDVEDERIKDVINKAEKTLESFYNDVVNNNFEIELKISDNVNLDGLDTVFKSLKNRIKFLDISELDINKIIYLMKTVDIDNDVQIVTKYNFADYCTKSDLYELLEYLNKINNYILRFDLSPLEICIFVNDLIRERPYKKSKKILFTSQLTDDDIAGIIQDSSNSRSIIKVFKSDEIVCAGFSNLYAAILDLVGIKADTITYLPTEDNAVGHMTNLVYLDDAKYDIKGLYEIDTTWGRKAKDDGTYDYQGSLKNYYHFARSLKEALKIKEINKLKPYKYDIEIFKLLPRINRLNTLLKDGYPNFIIESEINLILESCLKLAQKFNNKFLDKEIKDLKEIIVKKGNVDYKEIKLIIDNIYIKLFLCPLSSFKQALYRVKTIEHSIDKDKYPVTLEDIDEAYCSRVNTAEERLVDSIFSKRNNKTTDDQELDIARMKLISVLHKLAKDNVDKNPTKHI